MLLDLPDLPREKLFSFLSISDRLKARHVCKAWKFVIDTFRLPQRLCIYSTSYPECDRWLDSNRKMVIDDEQLQLKPNFKLSFWPKSGLRMEFFRNLQCLYLHEIPDKKLDIFLEQMNKLVRLRVLMIYGRKISGAKKFSSSSLESLSIKHLHCDARPELDTPNLRSLVVWNELALAYNRWCFRFPLTVKRLECDFFNPHLSQLKSLETIVCLQIVGMIFKLEDFKFLKRLEIWPGYEEQLERVEQIREEREALKRPVKLIICGFEELPVIFKRKRTKRCLELSASCLNQIANNRSKFVGYTPWPVELEAFAYQWFTDWIPIELLAEHFPNISYISVEPHSSLLEGFVRESGLIELLRRTGPQELRIEMNLTRQFYEQFTAFSSIKSLTIIAQLYFEDMENRHLERFEFQHFDCLLELKNLESIRVDCPKISTDFMCKLVKLPFFDYFKFSNPSGFSIQISFNGYRHLTETQLTQLTDDPISFSYDFDFDYFRRHLGLKKRVREVDDLVVEIKQMEENKAIKPYLVSL